MIRKRFKKKQPTRVFVKANHQIRHPEVRVLDEHGGMIGVMSTSEALRQAGELDKDLILVTENAKPPVAKIIDLAKYRYQLQQKKAEGRKKAKKQEIKEVRFTPFMGENDFSGRLKKVIKFLEKGDKVRLSLLFKGRAITKKEFGFEMYQKIFDATGEIGSVEIVPKMMGKKLIAQLMPVKKAKPSDAATDNTNED
jgi:translation initiation factor IF-3